MTTSASETEDDTCVVGSCSQAPTHTPTLIIPAPVGDASVDIAMTDIRICKACADRLKPPDIIGDEGWGQIVTQFQARGLAVPVRAQARLKWEPIQ
jgi:hypothetical protein